MRTRRAVKRGLGWMAAAALAFVVTGDNARSQSSTIATGQDPLQVLDLQVKPLVFLVLDTSGSMPQPLEATANGDRAMTGDELYGRFWPAKQVLKDIVYANRDKAAFLLAGYKRQGSNSVTTMTYTTYCLDTDTTCKTAAGAIRSDSFTGTGLKTTNPISSTLLTFGTASTADDVRIYEIQADPATMATKISGLGGGSNKIYNNDSVTVDTNGTSNVTITLGADAPVTPVLPTAGVRTEPRPKVTVRNGSGTAVTFYFAGPDLASRTADATCKGWEVAKPLDCSQSGTAQYSQIATQLDNELHLDSTGQPTNYTPATAYAADGGLRAEAFTPIANSLRSFGTYYHGDFQDRTVPSSAGCPGPSCLQEPSGTGLYANFASLVNKPKAFVVIVTDGDDSCEADSGQGGTSTNNMRRAAYYAQLLYQGKKDSGATADPNKKVETFLISLGLGVNATIQNDVALAGSGGTQSTTTLASPGGVAWNADLTQTACQAQVGQTGACRNVLQADDVDALQDRLNEVFGQIAGSGTFSAATSVTETVFEFVTLLKGYSTSNPSYCGGCDADDPDTRYDTSVPVSFVSTFDMPGFTGHVIAFRADSSTGAATAAWANSTSDTANGKGDAAQKLLDRVRNGTTGTDGMGTPSATAPAVADAKQSWEWTYAELTGSTMPAVPYTPASGARIKRRIISNPGLVNGRFTYAANGATVSGTNGSSSQTPYRLWPNPGTDTNLDVPLGITYPAEATDFDRVAKLLANFNACELTNMPGSVTGGCKSTCTTGSCAAKFTAAKDEARKIILAYTAGAQLSLDIAAKPRRDSTTGALLFKSRSWVLADSVATGAVIAPPIADGPDLQKDAYDFRNAGPRSTSNTSVDAQDQGYGLRDPDKDGDGNTTGITGLKPRMTVYYYPGNDGLHAFRAGPNCSSTTPLTSCTEKGGEELWQFVPFDQLSKLALLMKATSRADHVYMIASSVRFADVLVPATSIPSESGVTVPGTGRWRTLLYFGRGIAGKYYTALDVTMPGSYTKTALTTQLPGVVWSRGNPDTVDGTTAGTAINGAADQTAYSHMGQTWSVPALSRVDTTISSNNNKDFVLFVGSGYGDVGEGSTLYKLDAITGDVLLAQDVGTRRTDFRNAIVAGPAALGGNLNGTDARAHPASTKVKYAYVGDIQGQIWRFGGDSAQMFADLGIDQPIGVPVALLNISSLAVSAVRPHIFVESGADSRVPIATTSPFKTPPFKMWGLRDDDNTGDPSTTDGVSGPAAVVFTQDFPSSATTTSQDYPGFRGSAQPATTLACFGTIDSTGHCKGNIRYRVFFVGTEFQPANTDCTSHFYSIIYALGAETGGAAYDLPDEGGKAIRYSDQRIVGVRAEGGTLIVDKGLDASTTPAAPAPPRKSGKATSDSVVNVFTTGVRQGTRICR